MRQATDLLDSYFWIKEAEAFDPASVLNEIKATASTAIAEFERVVQLRASAASQLGEQEAATKDLVNKLRQARHEDIQSHVNALASLRELTGRVITLRDVRYMDLGRVEALEKQIKEWQERQARHCVAFLLQDDAMAPYSARIEAMEARVADLAKVNDAEELRKEAEAAGGELEMLIETVTNLKIDDATQRTAIIDSISGLFAGLNRLRAALQNKRKQLGASEGAAEFASQLKLLDQAVVNYLDVCDSPAKCEDYLSRIMVQIEELEGQFSEFDEYIAKLTDQRETVYNAFEARRLALVEARNKRADTLSEQCHADFEQYPLARIHDEIR
jgi:vacuolar-type H+-ATPase subunit I/STV1